MREVRSVSPVEFLWLGLYVFAGFSIELILGLLINALNLSPLSKDIHSIVTGLLWFAWAIFLIEYSKRKFEFDIFSIKYQLKTKDLLFIIPVVAVIILAMFLGFGGFKPIVEFNNGSEGSILTYLCQIFYYLGESSLIVLGIAFGQRFFETQFKVNPVIPSGGFFLAFTWGIMHIFLQGVSGGLFSISFSILAGILYVVCKKDIRWSYLFIALAFIL